MWKVSPIRLIVSHIYRREIGLGLFKPGKAFLSDIILDLFYIDSYRYKIASIYQ